MILLISFFSIDTYNGFDLRPNDTSYQCTEFVSKVEYKKIFCFHIRFSESVGISHSSYRHLFSLHGENMDIHLGWQMVINTVKILIKMICDSAVGLKYGLFHLYVWVGKILSKMSCQYSSAQWKNVCLKISSSNKVNINH